MSFSQKVKKEIQTNLKENESQLDKQRLTLSNLFLTKGSITDPNKDYHLEFLCSSHQESTFNLDIIQKYNLKANIVQRKNNWIIYIKDSEDIADFLNIVAAHDSLMDFYNVRILKDISGSINRKVNLETANLNKTINAAVEQEEDIIFLLENYPKELSADLLAVAYARIENMDSTLSEIAESFNPPLTKSCVNHRMRKIRKIAKKLQDNKGN